MLKNYGSYFYCPCLETQRNNIKNKKNHTHNNEHFEFQLEQEEIGKTT